MHRERELIPHLFDLQISRRSQRIFNFVPQATDKYISEASFLEKHCPHSTHAMPASLQSPIQLKYRPPWKPSRMSAAPLSNPRKRHDQVNPIPEELPSYTEVSRSRSGFETPDIPPPPYSRKVRAPPPKVIRKLRTPPLKVARNNPPASELPPYYDVDPVIAAARALQNSIAGRKPVNENAQPAFAPKARHKLKSTLRI